MDRRSFLKKAGAGAAVVSAGVTTRARAANPIEWKMVTTWPKNFPGLGTGANALAATIEEMSGGRIKVKVYGAGEMVPPYEVFDAVSKGTAQMGHGAAFYWKGKAEAAQFFTGVPFGLNAIEMNAWLHYGGGMQLWTELYKPFGLVPLAAGNSGVQMAGWFNKEIHSMNDIKGLKMRIAGLGGDVFKAAGGTPVNIPGGEIFSSLKSGAIDACEWVGPYNDLAFGLHKAAKYYYYPGWQEPGSTLECIVNERALHDLPKDLQAIVIQAAHVSNEVLTAEFTAQNARALHSLKTEHKVLVKAIPDDVLKQLHKLSEEVVAGVATKDAMSKKVYDSYLKFRAEVKNWHDVSELAYYNARNVS
ncbi:MAG: TRAP transporter substrate-binding protein [Gammaproteobacteria bacterium]|nr:TRAP transporter substrate-binding protein [Gammaproteobacteria bacterium]